MTAPAQRPRWSIIEGDVMERIAEMETESVQTCITSPPYWGLRDYGHEDQIGLEATPEEYTEKMVAVFREVRRVLRDDGTLWLNMGDSYANSGSAPPRPDHSGGDLLGTYGKQAYSAASQGPARITPVGLKPKDLVGIPWRVAFALQADGWYLRSDIIWAKPNPMPESITDRPTKSHEYLFLMSKSKRYYYDSESIRETAIDDHDSGNGFVRTERISYGGRGDPTLWVRKGSGTRNRRTVWTIPTQPFPGAHFAVFPPALVEPCVLAGSREDDLVLDPFAGSGTVGVVCRKHSRRFIGIEINPKYAAMARGRLGGYSPTDEATVGTPGLWSAA